MERKNTNVLKEQKQRLLLVSKDMWLEFTKLLQWNNRKHSKWHVCNFEHLLPEKKEKKSYIGIKFQCHALLEMPYFSNTKLVQLKLTCEGDLPDVVEQQLSVRNRFYCLADFKFPARQTILEERNRFYSLADFTFSARQTILEKRNRFYY
jgi:hypothetical protein